MVDMMTPQRGSYLLFLTLFMLMTIPTFLNYADAKDQVAEPEKWKKKDVRDYSDADVERLFDQWEDADEDELEEDELPEYKRPQPKIDLTKMNPNDPEGMLKAAKKGRTLMMFATVSGNPTEKESEEITKIWQSSLFNANIETQRYVVGQNRVLFLLKDGAIAWDIKQFLVEQERCALVTIEGQDYPGKGSEEGSQEKNSKQKSEKKTKKSEKKGKKVKSEARPDQAKSERKINKANTIDKDEL